MLKASGMVRTVSTPAASSPKNTRRTMFTFSLLLNTDPCATRRRISLPEDGLAIMPTHATWYLSSQLPLSPCTAQLRAARVEAIIVILDGGLRSELCCERLHLRQQGR